MKKYSKVDTGQFFKMTGMHLRFDGVAATKSVDLLDKLMDAAEKNYFLRGEPFDPKVLDGLFHKARQFNIRTDEDFILERISKMKRIDKFFKTHAQSMARPLSVILKMIIIIKLLIQEYLYSSLQGFLSQKIFQ